MQCNAVRIVQKKLGWKEVGDEDDEGWDVYWTGKQKQAHGGGSHSSLGWVMYFTG